MMQIYLGVMLRRLAVPACFDVYGDWKDYMCVRSAGDDVVYDGGCRMRIRDMCEHDGGETERKSKC